MQYLLKTPILEFIIITHFKRGFNEPQTRVQMPVFLWHLNICSWWVDQNLGQDECHYHNIWWTLLTWLLTLLTAASSDIINIARFNFFIFISIILFWYTTILKTFKSILWQVCPLASCSATLPGGLQTWPDRSASDSSDYDCDSVASPEPVCRSSWPGSAWTRSWRRSCTSSRTCPWPSATGPLDSWWSPSVLLIKIIIITNDDVIHHTT